MQTCMHTYIELQHTAAELPSKIEDRPLLEVVHGTLLVRLVSVVGVQGVALPVSDGISIENLLQHLSGQVAPE